MLRLTSDATKAQTRELFTERQDMQVIGLKTMSYRWAEQVLSLWWHKFFTQSSSLGELLATYYH